MKKYLKVCGISVAGAIAFGLTMLLVVYNWRLALWVIGGFVFVMKLWERVDTFQNAPLPKSKAEFFTEIFFVLILLGLGMLFGYGIEWLLDCPAEYFEITLLKGLLFIFFSLLYLTVMDEEFHLWSDAKGSFIGVFIYCGCLVATCFALRVVLPLIL